MKFKGKRGINVTKTGDVGGFQGRCSQVLKEAPNHGFENTYACQQPTEPGTCAGVLLPPQVDSNLSLPSNSLQRP